MLGYIITVCNGDEELVQKRCSVLTWFEEWYVYFEMMWGRTLIRYVNLVDKADGWGITHVILRNIFDSKMAIVQQCRED